MDDLSQLVQEYFRSADFTLHEKSERLVIADKLGIGGDRDTRLVWVIPTRVTADGFQSELDGLVRQFESLTAKYPGAKYTLLTHTFEGITPDFRSEAARFRVRILVPAWFFDTPFKNEEAPEHVSAMSTLLKRGREFKRVAQPYAILTGNGDVVEEGEDLLPVLFERLTTSAGSCLHILVGAAGAGKSVLFETLFSRCYSHFLQQKNARVLSRRPIPFIPEYLRKARMLRTHELVSEFLNSDVAVSVSLDTFRWMLANSFSMWMFDGLDELYDADLDFFDFLMDPITQPRTRAQILVCARDSLLTSCEPFAKFLEDWPPALDAEVRLYRLSEWPHASKRAFAWLSLEGRGPGEREEDPPRVSKFLTTVGRSQTLNRLSAVPYYCALLMEAFRRGDLVEVPDDCALVERAVTEVVNREIQKGVLSEEAFEGRGLREWLETVAFESYIEESKGLATGQLEEYAEVVLRPDLPSTARQNVMLSLVQFPLFARGVRPGVVSFKHELVAEYLTGCYLTSHVSDNAPWVARSLGRRIDLADSLIMRYMAGQLLRVEGGLASVVTALKTAGLPDRPFCNLLQLLLLAVPRKDVIKANGISLETRDLSHVKFLNKDLSGVSLRRCNLAGTVFRACEMQNACLEGANLSGTRFEDLSGGALKGTRFGAFDRFDCIYVGKHRIDEREAMKAWIKQATGVLESLKGPCPAALQLMVLFRKFIQPDGSPRRDQLPEAALLRGRRFPGAPTPEQCVQACQRFGYLETADFRRRISRTRGALYAQMVAFVKEWRVDNGLKHLLDSLCKKKGCEHVPESR